MAPVGRVVLVSSIDLSMLLATAACKSVKESRGGDVSGFSRVPGDAPAGNVLSTDAKSDETVPT